jgi:Ca2+-binding RTX toxin-like protein
MVTIVTGAGLSSGIRVENNDIYADFLIGLQKSPGADTVTQLPNDRFEVAVTFQNGTTLLIKGQDPFAGSYTLTGITYRDDAGKLLVAMSGIDKLIFGGLSLNLLLNDIYSKDDVVTGTRFADFLQMESGADRIAGMAGADTINGGDRNDTISGDQGHDRLVGESGNDLMYGGLGRDRLQGDFGNDSLYGGVGADTLFGSWDSDLMYGGADTASDVFLFEYASDSGVGRLHDTIYGMTHTVDLINLRAVDANTAKDGNQIFAFSGRTAATHAVWLVDSGANTLVRADTNGDARADFEIRVANIDMLTAGDFIL